MVDRRQRVLPEQHLGRHFRPEVAHDRPHVAVGQLEPRAGERVGELLGVLEEAPRDRLVGRVEPQREVGGQHRREPPVRGVGRAGDDRLGVLRHPLVGAGRARRQLPLVAEEELEEVVAPLRRRRRPGHLEAARDRVARPCRCRSCSSSRGPAPRAARPPAPDRRCPPGRRRASCRSVWPPAISATVSSSFIAMRREGLADVVRRGERVGVAVRALGVHVDEAHLDGGERILELAVAGVALVAEPDGLRAPVHVLVRLPDVLAPAAEAERLEAHRLQRDVAGEHHQVGPREPAAVLLLHGPQQPARLVEVRVVRPAVERCEALLAGAGTAAAVADAVGAGAVPGHPDDERPVVAEVGGPPVLRGRQCLLDVLLDRREVEALEGGGVVEVLTERVRRGRVLGEDLQVEPVRPPAGVAAALGGMRGTVVCDRACGVGLLVHLADDGVRAFGHGHPFEDRGWHSRGSAPRR